MYISKNNGVSYEYDYSMTVVHFYQEVEFPPDIANITLNFDIRCNGYSDRDYVRVYLMPTDVPIVASTATFTAEGDDPNGSYRIGLDRYNYFTLPNFEGYNSVTINIPRSFAGQTRNLVFSWINGAAYGAQPPASIDNITLTYQSPSDPSPALLVSPSNGTTFLVTPITLSWTPEPYDSLPTSYTV